MKKHKTKDLCLCALFAALIAIGAFIRIPIPVCPFTLQVMFVAMAGLLLGAKLGALSAFVYMAIGLCGVPVFTQGGGPGYVLVPTFGYIIGFIFGALITGAVVGNRSDPSLKRLIGAVLAGLPAIYLPGMAYFYIISNFVINSPITVGSTLFYCFLVTVPGDIITCVLAAVLAHRLIPVLRRAQY